MLGVVQFENSSKSQKLSKWGIFQIYDSLKAKVGFAKFLGVI